MSWRGLLLSLMLMQGSVSALEGLANDTLPGQLDARQSQYFRAWFTRIVDEQDIPVIAYGLKTDFRGELFPGSYHLLCLADKFEELKSICWCGNKAHMNSRVNEAGQVMRDGEQVEIGGNDRYVSLCRKHYLEGRAYK